MTADESLVSAQVSALEARLKALPDNKRNLVGCCVIFSLLFLFFFSKSHNLLLSQVENMFVRIAEQYPGMCSFFGPPCLDSYDCRNCSSLRRRGLLLSVCDEFGATGSR